jgi:hypothetical protein
MIRFALFAVDLAGKASQSTKNRRGIDAPHFAPGNYTIAIDVHIKRVLLDTGAGERGFVHECKVCEVEQVVDDKLEIRFDVAVAVDAKCRVSFHEPPRKASAPGVSYVPVGSALIDMSVGGDAGGSTPTSTGATSSFAGINVSARAAKVITITKTFKGLRADLRR